MRRIVNRLPKLEGQTNVLRTLFQSPTTSHQVTTRPTWSHCNPTLNGQSLLGNQLTPWDRSVRAPFVAQLVDSLCQPINLFRQRATCNSNGRSSRPLVDQSLMVWCGPNMDEWEAMSNIWCVWCVVACSRCRLCLLEHLPTMMASCRHFLMGTK